MPHKCLACGNNPVSHTFSWFGQSFVILMYPLSKLAASSAFNRLFSALFEVFFKVFISSFRFFGIIKINDDVEKAAGMRGKVVWQEAIRRGIPMRSYIGLGGHHLDAYEAVVKGKKINFTGLPRLTEGTSEWWIDDKAILKRKLQAAGVPVARGGSFSRYAPLLNMFRTLEKPVIIKPRLGSRGRHTTTNISTEEDLKKAYRIAKQLCHWVVMEEHLVGSVYRGTVIDGKLVGVLRGDPPRVTGDGVHTIEQLVNLKNESRPKNVSPVVITSAHLDFLSRTGHSLSEVLPSGITIDLIEKVGLSYGGYSVEMIEEVHPDVKHYLERAGDVVHDPIVGFDFIIQDATISPQNQKWGIIECNGMPFINLHHFPAEGKPVNAAAAVWDYIEKNIDLV